MEPEATGPMTADDTKGWESISEWTGGIVPESVETLRSARELETLYPLIHGLAGRSLRDFLVRAAALEALVADGRPALRAVELAEVLYWLDDATRDGVLRALRAYGWLEHTPALGTTITDAGRWVYEILGFLHKRLRESDLRPSVAGVEYALRIGVDPVRHLESLRSRLAALQQEIESARASYSEVVLRGAIHKLDEALSLSNLIRTVLDRIQLDHKSARRTAREIHELLSRLHWAGAELHGAVTEIGRQYLHLTAGMTVEQIARALMRQSRERLAALGKEALLAVFSPPPLLNTETLAASAEQQVLRERPDKRPLEWEEPVAAPEAASDSLIPEEVRALLGDLGEVVRAAFPVPIADIVPRRTPTESFLRACLLPLVGDARSGGGIAAHLGALPADLETGNGGWPEPLADRPVAALTPGTIRPRDGQSHE